MKKEVLSTSFYNAYAWQGHVEYLGIIFKLSRSKLLR